MQVSYVSYLDIWMVICWFFVNFCMFEFIMVTFLISSQREKLAHKVEAKARIITPLVFIFINICYWPAVVHG